MKDFIKNFIKLNSEFLVDVQKDCIEICQNDSSIFLLLNSLYYPDAKSLFFCKLIHFFQKLPCQISENNLPYLSYSQGFTTYWLKQLENHKLIKIAFCEYDHETADLSSFKEIIDPKFNESEFLSHMYFVYFYKLRNFTRDDLTFINEMMRIIGIDSTIFEIYYDLFGRLYLKLKTKVVLEKILTGEFFKNLMIQKRIIASILKKDKELLQKDDLCLKRVK